MTLPRGRIGCLVLLGVLALTSATLHGQEPPAWERVPQLDRGSFISNKITALVHDATGVLWVGTDAGLVWIRTFLHADEFVPTTA